MQKHSLWNKVSFSRLWKCDLGSVAELTYLTYFLFYPVWKSNEGCTCSSDTLWGGEKKTASPKKYSGYGKIKCWLYSVLLYHFFKRGSQIILLIENMPIKYIRVNENIVIVNEMQIHEAYLGDAGKKVKVVLYT